MAITTQIFIILYMFLYGCIIMAIKHKVRMAGESLAVTILPQIAQLHDIKEGDYLESTPIGYGEFKIKKVE